MVEEMPDRVGDDGGQSGEDWIAGRAGNDGRDTTVVMESDEPIIMNAVRDEDGNMVAGKIARARPSTAVVC